MMYSVLQIREAQTVRAIFQDNSTLCNEVNEKVIQHFVHCIETHGKHVQYLKFLQTIVRAENSFIRKCQDMVMQEVCIVGYLFEVFKQGSRNNGCVPESELYIIFVIFMKQIHPSLLIFFGDYGL